MIAVSIYPTLILLDYFLMTIKSNTHIVKLFEEDIALSVSDYDYCSTILDRNKKACILL